MRFLAAYAAFCAALLLLAACASAPAGPPVAATTQPSTPATSASSRAAQLLGAAGRDNAPTRAEIERAFGEADIVRQDGAGTALTYRLDTCALLLLFAADQRNAQRLTEAHPSARHPDAPAPSLDQCATEASARRH